MADVIKDRDIKKLRQSVDKIFSSTKEDREKMSKYWKHFLGDIWSEEMVNLIDSERPYASHAFINMLFSVVMQTAPMLTDNNPIIHVVANQSYMDPMAKAYTNAIKYAWNVADVNRQLLHASMDAMVMKVGILKCYYDPTKSYGPDLCIEVVDPRDFFIAPGYDTIWDAPMVGVRSWKPLSWVRDRFPDVKDIEGAQEITEKDEKDRAWKYGESAVSGHENQFVRVYEVWLKDDDTMETILEEVEEEGEGKRKTKKQKYPYGKFVYFTDDQTLGVEAQDANHGLPPYVELKDYDIPHQFLGLGEADQIDGLNMELNLQLQSLLDYTRRHHAPNYEVDADAGVNIEQLKKDLPKGNQVFAVSRSMNDNSGSPLIKQITDGQFNPESLRVLSIIPEIIDEQSGVTDVSKGIAGKTERQSATEVATLLDSAHTRTRQRIRNQEWTVQRLGYLLVRIMQQYYTEPRQINWKEDSSMNYMDFGSSKAQAAEMIGPGADRAREISVMPGMDRKAKVPPEEMQSYEDYRKFSDAFSDTGELDPVYFEFSIEVETNSSLPRDQQSLANLALRLAQTQITPQSPLDIEAVLDVLRWPGKDDIIERKRKIRQEAMQGAQGGRPNAKTNATQAQQRGPQPVGSEPY